MQRLCNASADLSPEYGRWRVGDRMGLEKQNQGCTCVNVPGALLEHQTVSCKGMALIRLPKNFVIRSSWRLEWKGRVG